MTAINVCTHDGEHCDGAEFCSLPTCGVQIFSGFKDADERYCNDHKPATWDAEVAEMTEEEFDDQDEMYWTQWEIDDIDCDCPTNCPCRPSPEALQALYDADRARSEEDNKTYTITHAQLVEIGYALSDSESLMETLTEGPGDDEFCEYSRLEDVRKASAVVDSVLNPKSPYKQEMSWCELCNDERLEEDLNEDGLCEPCAEAKAKQGYLIGE